MPALEDDHLGNAMPTRRLNKTLGAGPRDLTGERDGPALPEKLTRCEPVRPSAESLVSIASDVCGDICSSRLPNRTKPRVTLVTPGTSRSASLIVVLRR